MKLLHKTLLYLMLAAVPVALVGNWLFRTSIRAVIRHEIDEQLRSDLLYASQQLRQAGAAARPVTLGAVQVTVAGAGTSLPPTFSNTTGWDIREQKNLPVRQLTATVPVGQRTYRLTVRQVTEEFEEIADLVAGRVLWAFLGLLGGLVLLNVWVAGRLWTPFYRLIDQLRRHRLDTGPPAEFATDNVAEFGQLSAALNEMSRNLHRQFVAQKDFTDHAAHEMQTPLALVGAELDGLLCGEQLSDDQVHHIERAQSAIDRLSRLNKSLLLLTKIENQQFPDRQVVDLSALTTELAGAYGEFATHRGLVWQTDIAPGVAQPLNPYLAEVLLSNLLKNAVIHSPAGAIVHIGLTQTGFCVENDGPLLPFPPDRLFDRFVKNPARPESTGLGLALVQQIAQRYGLTVRYAYLPNPGRHQFCVDWTMSRDAAGVVRETVSRNVVKALKIS
jgi:signal transduction histidine kinase